MRLFHEWGVLNKVFFATDWPLMTVADHLDGLRGLGKFARDHHLPVIPEQEIDRIFDPFYTTKPPGKGTGLGLSICERIVRDHDGSVSVRSNDETGTVFTVSLPVSRTAGRITSTEGAF